MSSDMIRTCNPSKYYYQNLSIFAFSADSCFTRFFPDNKKSINQEQSVIINYCIQLMNQYQIVENSYNYCKWLKNKPDFVSSLVHVSFSNSLELLYLRLFNQNYLCNQNMENKLPNSHGLKKSFPLNQKLQKKPSS